MKYHAPTDQFTISADDLKRGTKLLLYAIRKIRIAAKLDLSGYDNLQRESDAAEQAETNIIDAAQALGIDLGARNPGQIDVSKLL